MKLVALALLVVVVPMMPFAQIVTQDVDYKHGDVTLEGYLAYDSTVTGKRPGVLVVHEWTGVNDYTKSRVNQLAEMGFVAFAADIYGKGVRPTNSEEAAEQATIYRKDRALMRNRAQAGLDKLRSYEFVDTDRIAAIGYCFGGGTVLELARGGADVAGVVSFHGNLDTPDPNDARNIKASVLVLHGAADPHVPKEQVMAFRKEMNDAGVDWQLVSYGGAVHSFTNPGAGDDPSRGAAYNEKADKRSWKAMKSFFDEILK